MPIWTNPLREAGVATGQLLEIGSREVVGKPLPDLQVRGQMVKQLITY